MTTPQQVIDVRASGGRKFRRELFHSYEVRILLPFSAALQREYANLIRNSSARGFQHPAYSKSFSLETINTFLYLFHCGSSYPDFPPITRTEIERRLSPEKTLSELIEKMKEDYNAEEVNPILILQKSDLIFKARVKGKRQKTKHHPKGVFFYVSPQSTQ